MSERIGKIYRIYVYRKGLEESFYGKYFYERVTSTNPEQERQATEKLVKLIHDGFELEDVFATSDLLEFQKKLLESAVNFLEVSLKAFANLYQKGHTELNMAYINMVVDVDEQKVVQEAKELIKMGEKITNPLVIHCLLKDYNTDYDNLD